ncbi:FliM/FliN family flagellar motor switch protein [Novosphingobium piscinae]|uniref:FliM/FliN family flagellar motor switch protein n=1 Tax=Novosphingobium piscinae TaxID=1507448 RepID=A0A7X1G0N9_9SPHN|nr:FliM/FliN family flagellar motor switch protein [Novosphingobium piscinae]
MKPERPPVAARAVAQHCPELLRAEPGPEELLPLLTRAGERLTRPLLAGLAPLAGGKALTVKAKPAKLTTLEDIAMFAPDLAANSLIGVGAESLPLLASLDAAAVLRMVDRTFGGRGEAPSPLPAEFPVSAELMIVRLETMLVRELAAVLVPGQPEALRPLRRNGNLVLLEPFARDATVAQLELDVTEPGGDTWQISLALPLPTLSALFSTSPRRSAPVRHAMADPLAEPFADVPMQLSAVLVDMAMAMATVARLEPGMVVPVAVARQVPLRLGAVTVATGTVGAADDRVALQIRSAF